MSIIWSTQAEYSYEEILDDILLKFDYKIAYKLENKVQSLLEKLSKHQELCPEAKVINLRKCVVHKNTSLVYKISNDSEIILVTFIDNRTNHSY